jgi:hypothetical protein
VSNQILFLVAEAGLETTAFGLGVAFVGLEGDVISLKSDDLPFFDTCDRINTSETKR